MTSETQPAATRFDLSVFDRIAKESLWGDFESISGGGSTLEATSKLRPQLQDLLPRLGIRSMVDAPCGDFNWMGEIAATLDRYTGVDIVPDVIDRARDRARSMADLAPGSWNFQVGNIVTDILPRADALFCRDCLVHLPTAAVHEALSRIRKAGFRFLLTTTFPDSTENGDTEAGAWRPLNLRLEPFNLPNPLTLVMEGHPPPHVDKAIGVWAL